MNVMVIFTVYLTIGDCDLLGPIALSSLDNNTTAVVFLTLKVLVTTIDALGHFEIG